MKPQALRTALAAGLLLTALAAGGAWAQSEPDNATDGDQAHEIAPALDAEPAPALPAATGYTLERAVVGAGGAHATATGFALDATGGQPAAGLLTGPNLELQGGFWHGCSAAAPVAPVVRVARSGDDVIVSWDAVSADVQYQVWVSTNPYFDPDSPGGVAPIITALTNYPDYGAAASLENHFYVVRGVNACGVVSGNSARRGEFTFELIEGAP